MTEEILVQPELITPGCKPNSGGGRKRDEEDGAAPGSGKKGTAGITPKRVGISNPSSSGMKPAPRSGSSSSRPTKKSLSPTPSSSPIPLSPNPFQPLSTDHPHTPAPFAVTPPLLPSQPNPNSGHLSLKMTHTWGSRKKKNSILIKKRITLGKAAASRKSAASELMLPSLHTPAVEESAAKTIVTRKSLRVQAQADQLSTMSKALKRVRDKDLGSASTAGHMDKKIKMAAAQWLPDELDAIPLSVWDPNDMQMVVYQPGIAQASIGGDAGSPVD